MIRRCASVPAGSRRSQRCGATTTTAHRSATIFLAAGDVIPRDHTAYPLRIDQLLQHVSNTVASVHKEALATTVDELARAFKDGGADLQRLIDSGDALTAAATQALPETTRLIDDGRIVLETQVESGRDLRASVSGFADVAGTLRTSDPDLRLVLVRATDTPTYVQYGAADLGIAGKDVLYEHGGAGLYQPLDLGIAACRIMVAVPEGFDYAGAVRRGARLRVATKYLRAAREHFAAKGVHVDLIRLYGSMELAPLTGLADAIVDLVATGNTLRANHLVAVDEIMPITARLIVNQAALKMKRTALQPLVEAFEAAAAVHA